MVSSCGGSFLVLRSVLCNTASSVHRSRSCAICLVANVPKSFQNLPPDSVFDDLQQDSDGHVHVALHLSAGVSMLYLRGVEDGSPCVYIFLWYRVTLNFSPKRFYQLTLSQVNQYSSITYCVV